MVWLQTSQNREKRKKDITKLISVHDNIIILFHLVHCSFIFGHWWLHSNQFVKHVEIVFVQKLALFALHDNICGSFHKKATIHASALHCVLWQNLDEDGFDMLYKNYCCAAIPDPIWINNVPYERRVNMLSSSDNNFIIFLFDCERFRIESRFPV